MSMKGAILFREAEPSTHLLDTSLQLRELRVLRGANPDNSRTADVREATDAPVHEIKRVNIPKGRLQFTLERLKNFEFRVPEKLEGDMEFFRALPFHISLRLDKLSLYGRDALLDLSGARYGDESSNPRHRNEELLIQLQEFPSNELQSSL
jgi:hypothetical protein